MLSLILWPFVELMGALLFSLLIAFYFAHAGAMAKIKRFEGQKMHNYAGNHTFVVGIALDLMAKYGQRVRSQPNEVAPHPYTFMLDEIEGLERRFDGGKYPMVVTNLATEVRVHVSDPQVVQDIFVKENVNLEKHDENLVLLKDLLGFNLIFSKADAGWKAKRKALAHAFYKNTLVAMVGALRTTLARYSKKWDEQIRMSESGSIEFDAQSEIENLLTETIIEIAFGENICGVEIDFDFMTETAAGPVFESRACTLLEAFSNIFKQVSVLIHNRHYNPVSFVARSWFSTNFDCVFSKTNNTIKKNCATLRSAVVGYVDSRKQGPIKEDLLGMFLSSPDVFPTTLSIVNELMGFVTAATQNQRCTGITMLLHLAQDRESLKRVR